MICGRKIRAYTSSLSASATPSRVRVSVVVDLVRNILMISDKIFSPDFRQSSPMVREAVWGMKFAIWILEHSFDTHLLLLRLRTRKKNENLSDKLWQNLPDYKSTEALIVIIKHMERADRFEEY
jgi:hypothetical protein